MPKLKRDLHVSIKTATRAELSRHVMSIECDAFVRPVLEGKFLAYLKSRGGERICEVAVVQRQFVGYIVYKRCDFYDNIWRMAVSPHWQGRGIGKALIRHLLLTAPADRIPTIITVDVPQYNLAAQLFFRAVDFCAHHGSVDNERGTYEMKLVY